MEWGPLFRLTAVDRAEAMARHVQLAAQAAASYILEPDEARSILAEEWADWNDVDISDDAPFNAEDLASLEMSGPEVGDSDVDPTGAGMGGNPRAGQNGGGRESGDDGNQTDPTSN